MSSGRRHNTLRVWEEDQGGRISVLTQQEFEVEDQERPDDTLRRQLQKQQYKDKQVGAELKKKLDASLELDHHFCFHLVGTCVCGVHTEIQT